VRRIDSKSLYCLTRPWSSLHCYVQELLHANQLSTHPVRRILSPQPARILAPSLSQPRQADHSTASERASERACGVLGRKWLRISMVSASLCGRAVLYSVGVMVRTRVCWKVPVPQSCLTSDVLCGKIRCSRVCRTGLWGFRSAVNRKSAWLISPTVCSDAHCAPALNRNLGLYFRSFHVLFATGSYVTTAT
jgi:hypothetical protein